MSEAISVAAQALSLSLHIQTGFINWRLHYNIKYHSLFYSNYLLLIQNKDNHIHCYIKPN